MRLRVVSFNIQHGRTASGVVDTDALAGACAGLRPDVLALQEVDVGVPRSGRADEVEVVARATGLRGVFGIACSLTEGSYGNALLVRGEVDRVEVIPLPRLGESEPRSTTVVSVRHREATGPVTVACAHLSVQPAESAVQLAALVDVLSARPTPQVVAGDFNRVAEELAPLVDAGFTLAVGPATFPAQRPRRQIDHVAVAGGEIGEIVAPRAAVSDHRPLVAEVVIADAEAPSANDREA